MSNSLESTLLEAVQQPTDEIPEIEVQQMENELSLLESLWEEEIPLDEAHSSTQQVISIIC